MFDRKVLQILSIINSPADVRRRLPESLIERGVEDGIGDGRQHAEGQGTGVPHVDHGLAAGEQLPEVVEEHAEEDHGSPAEEENGRDQGQEDVGAAAAAVDRRVLAGGPA